jgi:aspartate aminotransferase
MRSAFARRRDAVVDALSGVRGVSAPKPDGAFYLFLDVRDWLKDQAAVGIGTSTALAEALLDHANTAMVPGEAFGAPGHLRLSYAADDLHLLEGARQIKAFLANQSLPNSRKS